MSASVKFFEKLKKFNTVILVSIAILICVAASIIGYNYVQNMKKSLWTQIVSDITEVTSQGGHAFEMYVQKERESLNVLTTNMHKYTFTEGEPNEEVMLLFNAQASESGYFAMAILYDEGELIEKDENGNDVEIRSITYLARRQGDDIINETVKYSTDIYSDYEESGITEPYINNYTGQKTLGYYRRFTFADGRKAIVRKGQLMSYVTSEFSLSFYNDTGFSYIVKRNGDIVIRPTHKNSNRTGTNIFEILEYDQSSNEEANLLEDAIGEGLTGAMLSTGGGEERVICFVPLSETQDWYIVSVIPNSSVSRNIEDVLKSTLTITVLVIVIAVIFTLFILTTYFFRRKVVAKEAEVKYREQLFGILANNTDDVFIMTPHGKAEAEYLSPNITRVMGLDEAEVKADLHLLGKSDGEEGENRLYGGLEAVRDLKDGETLTGDSARTHRQTGETRYFHETVYRASIDGVDKDIIVFSDRTAEKLAEAALTEAMETAKAASRAKSSFLSSMSHDIRTPMNAIVGMTSIATKHLDDTERVKDCLAKITMSSNHLLTLINDVLDISKIESGKLNLSPVVFSLRDTVTNLVNIVRPQIADKALSFAIHVNGVTYEHLYADVLRVNQIFINILSNAVKYTPKGGKIVVDLSEQVLEKDKTVRLIYRVKDTGIGMSPEYMKTMYDTFSRAEDSRTNTIQGTGLGLAIVKQMVTLMGGTIDCESELNKGTTFTVTLDLPIGEKEVKKLELPHIDMLIVDDDEMFLDSVQDAVSELGAHADVATSGQEAIDKVKEHGHEYAVVIVDWKMPGMSGLDTIREIRKIIPKDTPIILVSAYDWDDIEAEAKTSGVDGFISKPLFRSYIYEKLCSVLKLNEPKSKKQTLGEKNDLTGIKLLVAEDNDLNWEVISVLLDMYGISCARAENGQICVDMMEQAEDGAYDLILMDVQMPVMNGRDATRAIRKSKRKYVKSIPIIAMTADAFAEDIAACMEAGMDGHLSKPVDMDKLCQQIRKVLFGKV